MSNQLTREQYEQLVNDYITVQAEALSSANVTLEQLNLQINTFHKEELGTIDSSLFLECDDDWGIPLPFGWIATEDHFTGTLDQDYYLDNIIEVSYGD